MTPRSLILPTLAALMAANLAGLVVGVHDGFASFGSAILNGTYTNAPLPIYLLQIAGVALLLGGRGRLAGLGRGVGAARLPVRPGGVLFRGGLGAGGVGAGHVAIQSAITAATALLWGLT